MKKLAAILLCIMMIVCANAALALETGDRAAVAYCNEFITLREEESTSAAEITKLKLDETVNIIDDAENGFVEVDFRGMNGYVLEKYLKLQEDYRGEALEITEGERSVINLFLTDFSKQAMTVYDVADLAQSSAFRRDAVHLQFAIQNVWFNHPEKLEWGDWTLGNVRVKMDDLPQVVLDYFNQEVSFPDAADYNQMDNYYYWQETGGNVPMGFASLKSVESLGDGRYAVRFDIYGAGEEWTNDVCSLTAEEAAQRYEKFSEGMAVIATDTSLANRGALWLERWIVR